MRTQQSTENINSRRSPKEHLRVYRRNQENGGSGKMAARDFYRSRGKRGIESRAMRRHESTEKKLSRMFGEISMSCRRGGKHTVRFINSCTTAEFPRRRDELDLARTHFVREGTAQDRQVRHLWELSSHAQA